MRRVGVMLTAMSLACGGTPSAPSQPPPPPPAFVGEWMGVLDISYAFPVTGATTHDVCDHRWTVQAQSGTAFGGVFRSTSGTAHFPYNESCIANGTFTGSVLSSGQIIGLTFTPVLLGGITINRDCSVLARATFSGETSGVSLRVEGTDVIECPFNQSLFRVNRSILLFLNKLNP
jgi:hypothetical protein